MIWCQRAEEQRMDNARKAKIVGILLMGTAAVATWV
jgi:hypothetical protein